MLLSSFSDVSSFPLLSEHTINGSRYSSGGAVDVSQHLENVGPFYQMHRMSTNDGKNHSFCFLEVVVVVQVDNN